MFMYLCPIKKSYTDLFMPHILNIETSTAVCSVALSSNGKILFERVSHEGPSHASLLGLFVEETLLFAKQHHIKLDAVAVSSGPGSYTGLRIGVSLAKGLCFGYDIPLISIPTLEIMASQVINEQNDADALYCAMIDARRMEVYAAIYNSTQECIRKATADIVDSFTYAAYLENKKVYFFGNGAEKCQSVIDNQNAVFLPSVDPEASQMMHLAEQAYSEGRFEDVAYFEPFYLKEFQATIPKNKVLG